MMATANDMLESEFVRAWLKDVHPKALVYFRQRVGPWPNGDRTLGVTRPFPDVVMVEDGKLLIVEAKVRPDTRAIGQIELYADQAPTTPELYFAKDLPIRKIFLTTRVDPVLKPFAESRGIEYEVYLPAWLRDRLEERAAQES